MFPSFPRRNPGVFLQPLHFQKPLCSLFTFPLGARTLLQCPPRKGEDSGWGGVAEGRQAFSLPGARPVSAASSAPYFPAVGPLQARTPLEEAPCTTTAPVEGRKQSSRQGRPQYKPTSTWVVHTGHQPGSGCALPASSLHLHGRP